MSFRLSNISLSFQGYINKILTKKLNIFISIYLDDLFIKIKYLVQAYIQAI